LPFYGVQFHPESIGTPMGAKLVENFLQLSSKIKSQGPKQQCLPNREQALSDC
jgi:GMP synthase-like glutamine amidotransferase